MTTLKAGQQPSDLLGQLMLRYWGVGPELDSDDKEILMFALSTENKELGGSIHKDAQRLFKERFPKSEIKP